MEEVIKCPDALCVEALITLLVMEWVVTIATIARIHSEKCFLDCLT